MRGHRNSHTVPRFYLKGFAADGHLVAIRGARARRVGVKVASVERDVYALREPGGSLYQGLEQRFAQVEQKAAPAHRSLTGGALPAGVDWLHYLLYLGLAALRTRRGLQMSVNAMPAELVAMAPPGSDEARRLYLQSLIERLWPRCVWLFGQMDRRLVTLPESLRLVTADHPVGLWTGRAEIVGQIGLMAAPFIVHPIDRRHALWLKKPMDAWPSWLDDPWCAAANANWAMTQAAVREVFVHPDDTGRILLWLPDGGRRTALGPAVPVARTPPLWVPGKPPAPDPSSEELEAVLARSARSRALEFIARETRVAREAVLAAEMPHGFGPFAALIRAELGFSTMVGEISPRDGRGEGTNAGS
jgi:Protein of unknown function (DUF4238)